MIDLKKLKLILGASYEPIPQSSRRLLKVHSDGGMHGRYTPSSTGGTYQEFCYGSTANIFFLQQDIVYKNLEMNLGMKFR